MKIIYPLLIFCLFQKISFSQNRQLNDSLTVFQQEASLFSNSYIFYSNGTFKHFFNTDDGHTWYGTGTYEDKGNKRVLKFGDPDLNFKKEFGSIHYESNFERTLKISGKKFLSKDYYYTTRKRIVVFAGR